MHLISVLLPEPDGPQTTTTSPRRTVASCSRAGPGVASVRLADVLEHDHVARAFAVAFDRLRERKADRQVDDRDEGVHLGRSAVARGDDAGRGHEIAQRDDVHQRGVLEDDDDLVEQQRRHRLQALRQDDVAHHLPSLHAGGEGGLGLSGANAADRRADDLAIERRLEEDEGDQRRGERADRAADDERAPGSRTRTAPGSAAPCASRSHRPSPARRSGCGASAASARDRNPAPDHPSVATATSRALSAMPSARNGHERAITPQSKSLTAPPVDRLPRRSVRSSARMSAVTTQADQQVDHGRHREGLETMEGVVLDVPALAVSSSMPIVRLIDDIFTVIRNSEVSGPKIARRPSGSMISRYACSGLSPVASAAGIRWHADRGDAGANLLGDTRTGEQADADDRRHELRLRQLPLDPQPHRLGRDLRERRSTRGTAGPAAACCGTPGCTRSRPPEGSAIGMVRATPAAMPTTSAMRPAAQADQQGPAETRPEPAPVGLAEQDPPVPGVVHGPARSFRVGSVSHAARSFGETFAPNGPNHLSKIFSASPDLNILPIAWFTIQRNVGCSWAP